MYNVKLDVAVVDPWPINRTSTDSLENKACTGQKCHYAMHKPSYSQQVLHNTTSEVVWSRLKSHAASQVKSSQVECDQVDGGRLGVILASSRVTSSRSGGAIWRTFAR